MSKELSSVQTVIHNLKGAELIEAINTLSNRVAVLEGKVTPPPKTEFVTITWTANFLNVSKPTVYDWIRKGILLAYKIGNRTRLKRNEVESALVQISNRKGGKL